MQVVMLIHILQTIILEKVILANIQLGMLLSSIRFFLTELGELLIFGAHTRAHMSHCVPINSCLPKSMGRSMKFFILVRVFNGEEQIQVRYFPKHTVISFGF